MLNAIINSTYFSKRLTLILNSQTDLGQLRRLVIRKHNAKRCLGYANDVRRPSKIKLFICNEVVITDFLKKDLVFVFQYKQINNDKKKYVEYLNLL